MVHLNFGLRGVPIAPFIERAGRAFVCLLPVSFVVFACVRYGIPYFKDSNETFHSYLQGWNLVFAQAKQHAYLTNNGLPGLTQLYTHNPNLPRYIHAILFAAGVETLERHILVISLISASLTTIFIRRLLGPVLGSTMILFFMTDWIGFQFLTNTYRTLAFPLFWGTVLAMRSWPWAAAAFFLLFQYEYAFAIFVGCTALIFTPSFQSRAAGVAGAASSILLFGIQVYSALGWQGMLDEFVTTIGRRSNTAGLGSLPDIYSMFYGDVVWVICALGFSVATIAQLRKDLLAKLFMSMLAGGATAALLFRGYVYDAYFLSALPFLTFFITVGSSVVAEKIGLSSLPVIAAVLALNGYRQSTALWSGDYIRAVRGHNELVFTDLQIHAAGFAANPLSAQKADSYLFLCAYQRCQFSSARQEPGELLLEQGNDFYISRRLGRRPDCQEIVLNSDPESTKNKIQLPPCP